MRGLSLKSDWDHPTLCGTLRVFIQLLYRPMRANAVQLVWCSPSPFDQYANYTAHKTNTCTPAHNTLDDATFSGMIFTIDFHLLCECKLCVCWAKMCFIIQCAETVVHCSLHPRCQLCRVRDELKWWHNVLQVQEEEDEDEAEPGESQKHSAISTVVGEFHKKTSHLKCMIFENFQLSTG